MDIAKTFKALLTAMVLVPASVAVSAQEVEYFQPMAMEGVELMGAVKYGMLDYLEITVMEKGFYEFKAENLYQPEKANTIHQCQVAGGSVYHDGKIYSNEYNDAGGMHLQKPIWRVYDAKTFEVLYEKEQGDNCVATTTSLAYDPVTNKIYGFLYTFTEVFFVSIVPETGEITRIAQLEYHAKKWLAIACKKDGNLYCIYTDRTDPENYTPHLARINKKTGKVAEVGELSIHNLPEGDIYYNANYSQAMCFNNADNRLYWIFESSSGVMPKGQYTAIMEVTTSTNPTATLRAYMVDYLNITGAFFLEPAYTAPAIVSDFEFVPTSEDREQGTLNFKIPATDYVGDALTAPVTVTVKQGETTLVQKEVQPGSDFVSDIITFTNDMQHITITVTNAAGEDGPTIKRSFYTGYDVPKACQNIRLTNEGLTTTLSWEPPVEGQNGAPINTDLLTYTVVRYPYEVTVAKGLKECKFVEEHPADMTRYVYRVIPVDHNGRQGADALSNNLIVGTPLDVPYGGYFKDAFDMYNYYTILDVNGDGATWNFDDNTVSAFYQFSYYNDADDWMISPPINYKKGKTYELKFKAYSSMANYLESMEVYLGKERTPEGQNQRLMSLPEVPAVDEENPVQEYKVTFTVPEDGVYYYGFHASSPAYQQYLYLFHIRVNEVNTGAIGEVNTDKIMAVAGKGYVRISNPDCAEVKLYNLQGGLIDASNNELIECELPAGVYVVSASGKTEKVVVY